MKREIKFRVRDSDSKKILGYEMFNVVLNNGFCFYYANDVEQILNSEFSNPAMIRPESPIGQLLRDEFTGLLDKNGKEIFEGDLINIDTISLKPREVIFTDGCFKYRYKQFVYKADEFQSNEIEVIGNIYENPELI